MQRAEDVSRDGTGRVAVAAVVDGGNDAGGKVVRVPQRAVDGDGERLLRDPALAEAVDVGEIRLVVVRKPDGEVDARGQLVQVLVAGKERTHRVARLAHDLQQRLRPFRIDDAVQDVGQNGGRHIAERVPVRDGGELCAFAVERLDGHGSVPAHAQRGDAHDAAAALAVVLRVADVAFERRLSLLLCECGQAGVAGRPAPVQCGDVHQPADARAGVACRGGCALRDQPVLIGAAALTVRLRAALFAPRQPHDTFDMGRYVLIDVSISEHISRF